jgi:glutathione S-transferase
MKLYFAPGACSLSPHIVMRETGMKFDLEQVNNQEKKTKSGVDYWTINGKGQVPVLEFDNGERLTEARSCSGSPTERGCRPVPPASSPSATACRSGSTSSPRSCTRLRPIFRPTTPDAYKAISKENLEQSADWLDKQLAGKRYLMGDKFTVADAYSHGAALDRAHRHGSGQVAEPPLHVERVGATKVRGAQGGRAGQGRSRH